MFGLELHSAHQNEPEKISMLVISTRDDLVVNEVVFDVLIISVFPFVISDQDEG